MCGKSGKWMSEKDGWLLFVLNLTYTSAMVGWVGFGLFGSWPWMGLPAMVLGLVAMWLFPRYAWREEKKEE